MKTLLEILTEGKQVGTIYHYTILEDIFPILQTNSLKSFPTEDQTQIYSISFTRNKRFHRQKRWVGRYKQMNPQCRLTIDGDKLSDRYKIQPYAEPSYSKPTKHFEAEQRIQSKTQFTIPIINYLISVDLVHDYSKDSDQIYLQDQLRLIKWCKQNNIPFNILDSNGDPIPPKTSFIQKIKQSLKLS